MYLGTYEPFFKKDKLIQIYARAYLYAHLYNNNYMDTILFGFCIFSPETDSNRQILLAKELCKIGYSRVKK